MSGEVRGGLDSLSSLGVGRGSLELLAGATTTSGGFLRLEAGYKPMQNLSLFGYAQASMGAWGRSAEVGAGLKVSL